eukprot:CAMPEP_0185753994 /NCGR_PEP_ID=MMETSP1174-20130828/12657_1 /TAXON_ID=35687 /ORGANISM="Dictyocha speculum, Strain CCMP1381" /LENGTH=155 /DNA_ID=CAMNT_0028432033 /DNA_START=328 /DNA_END=795 /DNA_ORIENTATION=+
MDPYSLPRHLLRSIRILASDEIDLEGFQTHRCHEIRHLIAREVEDSRAILLDVEVIAQFPALPEPKLCLIEAAIVSEEQHPPWFKSTAQSLDAPPHILGTDSAEAEQKDNNVESAPNIGLRGQLVLGDVTHVRHTPTLLIETQVVLVCFQDLNCF